MIDLFRQKARSACSSFPCSLSGTLKLLLVCVVFSAGLYPVDATAARKRVIFQLANLRQWVELNYDYIGTSIDNDFSGKRTSQRNEFEEMYHLEIDYAILSRNLVNGSLNIGLGLNQKWQNESGVSSDRNDNTSGHLLEYRYELFAFERKPYPFSLTTSRNQERISSPFSRPYDRTSENLTSQLHLRNRIMPVQLLYQKYDITTEGVGLNNNQENTRLSLGTALDSEWLGEIDMTAEIQENKTFSEGSTANRESKKNIFDISHTYSWDTFSQPQTLTSSYNRQKEDGLSGIDSDYWVERLNLKFGKALESRSTYSHRRIISDRQNREDEKFRSLLEHELFDSLITRLHYDSQQIDFLTGNNRNWERGIQLNYTKQMPRDSTLDLDYSYEYGETQQNVQGNELVVLDESLTVQLSGNLLNNINVVGSSIVVYNQARTIVYSENVDYEIRPFPGDRTELVFFTPALSGAIALNDVLSIDYTYQVNSAIEYATETNSVSTQLSLFQNKLRFYANYSQTDQDLISGTADTSPLVQSKRFLVGVDIQRDKHDFGLNYFKYDTTLNTEDSIRAYWRYSTAYKKGILNLYLENDYTTTEANEGISSPSGNSNTSNVVTLQADYKKVLNRRLKMELNSHVYDIRQDVGDQQDISFGIKFETALYKMRVLLDADVTWQRYENSTSRNDSVLLSIIRYF